MKFKAIVATFTVATCCGIVGAANAGTASGAMSGGGVFADEPKAPDTSRRVCRSSRPTGSRLPQRVCRTQREWDEAAQRMRDGLDRQSREDTIQNCRGGSPNGQCIP